MKSTKTFLKIGLFSLGIIVGVLLSAFGGYMLGRGESQKELESSQNAEEKMENEFLWMIG